jgi:hypothetical protein
MMKLRTDFGLTQGQLIVIRVRASNIIGYGDYSETNTDGAVIATEPQKMLPPYIGEDIDLNKLQVRWYAIFNEMTGGSTVLSYNLQYD